jgi:hypothetical protein
MNISLNDSLVLRPEVVFRELDDEAVLLNLKTGTYFGLDPVGTRVWQLLVEDGSLARVLETLLQEYEVEPATLEWDLLNLSRQLCEHGLGDLVAAQS